MMNTTKSFVMFLFLVFSWVNAEPADVMRIGSADSMTMLLRNSVNAESEGRNENVDWQKPVYIALAKGEFENAQIAIEASSDQMLHEVKVTLTPFVCNNDSHHVWPPTNISLWRVDDIEVYNLWEPHQSMGWFPDPLFPLEDTFSVAVGQRQRILVSFLAAENMEAGVYKGEVVVTAGNMGTQRLPVEVTVWDFQLPKEQNFTLTIPIWGGQMEKMYPGTSTPQRRQSYLDMLYDHRVSPFPLTTDEIDHALEKGVRKFNLGCFAKDSVEPEKAKTIGETAALWRRKGWDKTAETFVLLGDEAPQEFYPFIQKQGNLMQELAPEVERCFTISLEMIRDMDWVSSQMKGAADTIIMGSGNCYPVDQLSRQIQANGFNLWWYYVASHYYIPTDSLEARQVFWRHWKYQVPGQLHWGMSYWGDSNIAGRDGKKWPDIPWDSKESRGGDGYLAYPAPDGRAYLPSVRLELLRDGIEDYEYFHLLKVLTDDLEKSDNLGLDITRTIKGNRALLAIDDNLVKSYAEYDKQPENYRAYRKLLAQAIIDTQGLLLKQTYKK